MPLKTLLVDAVCVYTFITNPTSPLTWPDLIRHGWVSTQHISLHIDELIPKSTPPHSPFFHAHTQPMISTICYFVSFWCESSSIDGDHTPTPCLLPPTPPTFDHGNSTLIDSTPGVLKAWRKFAHDYSFDATEVARAAHGRRLCDTLREYCKIGDDEVKLKVSTYVCALLAFIIWC
jgi:hypothetical protein